MAAARTWRSPGSGSSSASIKPSNPMTRPSRVWASMRAYVLSDSGEGNLSSGLQAATSGCTSLADADRTLDGDQCPVASHQGSGGSGTEELGDWCRLKAEWTT